MSVDSSPSDENSPKTLPTFEDWMDLQLSKRPNNELIRSNTLYYGLKANLAIHQQALMLMAKENSCMFEEASENFVDLQKQWHYIYSKIIIIRSMCISFYDLPLPLVAELLPENEYCGTLLSLDSYKTYMTRPTPGVQVRKPERAEDYKPVRSLKEIAEDSDSDPEEESEDVKEDEN